MLIRLEMSVTEKAVRRKLEIVLNYWARIYACQAIPHFFVIGISLVKLGLNFFGRIGCFLHGCCFGKPTELFCGVIYPEGSAPFYRYGATPLHPVQIYESLCNIILAIIAMILLRKSKRGVTMSFYLISYGLLRFLNEFLRGDHNIRNNNFTI